MKLSDFLPDDYIFRNGEFASLGYVDTHHPGVLAYADNAKYLQQAVQNPNVSCIITTSELSDCIDELSGVVITNTPRKTFYNVHKRLINEGKYDLPFDAGIGDNCKIHPSAIVSKGCQIGDNVTIGAQAVILDPVWIGSNVTIEPGVKLGTEGILYERTKTAMQLIPHAGYVRIHDHVSLMTNSVVVRSVHNTDVTEVRQGALIGLGSIVGHDAKVHEQAVISNQCVIARRSVIGKDAFIGTNVMIKEHTHVGDGAKVMAGSVVITDVAPGSTVSGNFAIDHNRRMLDFARSKRQAS